MDQMTLCNAKGVSLHDEPTDNYHMAPLSSLGLSNVFQLIV